MNSHSEDFFLPQRLVCFIFTINSTFLCILTYIYIHVIFTPTHLANDHLEHVINIVVTITEEIRSEM